MDERDDDQYLRPPNEGVRIIGPDEAQAAVDLGQAARRRSADELRPTEGQRGGSDPRASVSFPLGRGEEPPPSPRASSVWSSGGGGFPGDDLGDEWVTPLGEDATIDVGPPTGPVALPEWTDAPTGQVPRVILGDEEDTWATRSGRQPMWRDERDDWDEPLPDDSLEDPFRADEESRVGALDSSRGDMSDLYSFDDPVPPEPPPPVEPPPAPEPPPVAPTAPIRTRQRDEVPPYTRTVAAGGGGGGRDLPQAVLVGVLLGGTAIIAGVVGAFTMFLVAFVGVMACAVEAFGVFQRAGYKPATLLGLTAVASLMVSAYASSFGSQVIPLVISLTLIATMLWYLAGVVHARPVLAIATTILGVVWIGVLGSYAALMLNTRLHPGHTNAGVVIFLAAVFPTVAYDVAGYFGGSAMGTRPIAPDVSPNKTVEGTVIGCIAAVIAGLIWGKVSSSWGLAHGLWLGIIVAIVAPLGDLCESLIKRDIGVKDMGTLLPGHGGVLDRFDGLLFALPAVYYLAHHYGMVL